MKCHIQFSGKNKKNIINLSSAENAQRVVKVKYLHLQTQATSYLLILQYDTTFVDATTPGKR